MHQQAGRQTGLVQLRETGVEMVVVVVVVMVEDGA